MTVGQLDVEIVGRGADLVLIHSLLSDRTSFSLLAERISDRRRLILPNLPGFGSSPRGAATIGDFADGIAGLIDELKLPQNTDVLGNGLGGFVALSLAERHGEKFNRAVLVGSAVAFPEAGRATFRALAERAGREGMAPLADAAMQRMFPAEFIAANPEIVADRKAVFEGFDPDVFAGSARALAALDFSPDLPRIRNPVLIVTGAKDGATPPALGRELAARLANAETIEMPGLGHCPHIQNADAFVVAISPFLGLGEKPG